MKPKQLFGAQHLVDALVASFKDALRTPEGVAAPVALVWTDADAQWRDVVPSLRVAVPELYSLGPYDPATRTGPAIWLRCVVDGALPDVAPAGDTVPILYLPGVSRQDLRAAGDCPPALKPLVELQYRGRVWHQRNGRDWTVDAFLVSEEGLGLDVAGDARTHEAMLRALPLLAEAPLAGLRNHKLEAEDFDRLAVGDPVRDLLRWMADPEGFEGAADGARWESFRSLCRTGFDLDPEDGVAVAAAALAAGLGPWDDVWRRFSESPTLYPGVARLLREHAANQGSLAFDTERSPVANDQAESRLRADLDAAAEVPHLDACQRVLALEAEHGPRRDYVWTRLGESPLATALAHLARLAALARSPLGGATVEESAAAYAAGGWQCDRAAIQALASVSKPLLTGVTYRIVKALYSPWADASARHFQALVAARDGDLRDAVRGVDAERDTCLVFADGLRFDAGAMLHDELEARGFRSTLTHRLTPLPTVTATAKPVVSPAHGALDGAGSVEDFTPLVGEGRQPATASRLRDEMDRLGVEVFGEDETGTAAREGGGWTEIGKLDEYGHSLDARLAHEVEREVERIADRVAELIESGWKRVRVVTDHGWLLMPGGLPKVELPAHLVGTKWSRCATVRGGAAPDVPTYAWHWHAHTRIASPPGIACFRVGYEYAHGGVSPQECVTPELVVERGEVGVSAAIEDVQWRGMRVRVRVRTSDPTVRVDLRLNWKRAETSIVATVKEAGEAGEVNLVVADDAHEGAAATVVVVDAVGKVLSYKPTTVGEAI